MAETAALIGAAFAGPASGLALASTGLAMAGTVYSVYAANRAVAAEQEMLNRQAEVEVQNAEQARVAGQATAKDQDMEAARILASVEARQGASGFLISSTSFQRRQERNRVAADDNRERVIEDAELQARSSENAARSGVRQAGLVGRERTYNMIGGALQIGTDLISGADLSLRRRAASLDRNRVQV